MLKNNSKPEGGFCFTSKSSLKQAGPGLLASPAEAFGEGGLRS
jgi:hypothetical protein